MNHARYVVVEDDFIQQDPLVIRDVGPWDKNHTITNDAEWVVQDLIAKNQLPEGRRLFYIDSLGHKDELLVVGGKFAGFKAGPR